MVHLLNSIIVTERTCFLFFFSLVFFPSHFIPNSICAWLKFVKYNIIILAFCFLNDLVILYGLISLLINMHIISRM